METRSKNPIIKWGILHLIALLLIGGLIYAFVNKTPKRPDTNISNIYIVRHAEKITSENAGHDPALTEVGANRANVLAELLRSKNITQIYSSNYMRTRDTAAPLAKLMGVEIQLYNPRDLPELAKTIKTKTGNTLIVGHSNTIMETAAAICCTPTDLPINESREYDRLYHIKIDNNDSNSINTNLNLTRFGMRYLPAE